MSSSRIRLSDLVHGRWTPGLKYKLPRPGFVKEWYCIGSGFTVKYIMTISPAEFGMNKTLTMKKNLLKVKRDSMLVCIQREWDHHWSKWDADINEFRKYLNEKEVL